VTKIYNGVCDITLTSSPKFEIRKINRNENK